MKKSQSLIIQFVLFFVIGFSLFLAISGFFRFRSEMIRNDVTNYELKLVSSYISSAIIKSVDECKQCDEVSIRVSLKNIAGYTPIVNLKNGLNVSTMSNYHFSTIHNLNETLGITESRAFASIPITLMYERIKNKLVVE
ncbi:MAG: hypothetical protein QXO27_03860 [Candidatus Aenigmatarchaeota archaeon]